MAAARPAKPVDESTFAGRFAQRLKTLRDKTGKTVDEVVAEMQTSGYDVARRSYYNWEQAIATPPINTFPVLAKVLGLKNVRTLLPDE